MEYYKLIALSIDDFSSTIFFEDNYCLSDIGQARKDKKELEAKGYTCILANIISKIKL